MSGRRGDPCTRTHADSCQVHRRFQEGSPQHRQDTGGNLYLSIGQTEARPRRKGHSNQNILRTDMAKLIDTPIDIHVAPLVRAIVGHDGRCHKDSPPTVAHIQIVIQVLADKIRQLQHEKFDLEEKIKRQKAKITELQGIIESLPKWKTRPEEEEILCPFATCLYGMGKACPGTCPGDWNDPECKEFVEYNEYERLMKEDMK